MHATYIETHIYLEYKMITFLINKFTRINVSDITVRIESYMKIERTKREICGMNYRKQN